ncbi:MAG: tRNA 2-thiouridine(34) synthase MnmA [Candidatus Omnitrophota bacterium]
MKQKVLAAMSGGVDSSVAAFLLSEQGLEVVGVTMCLGLKDPLDNKTHCCGMQAIEDAKKVCLKLKIPHYVMDFSEELEQKVIRRFIAEYSEGRTPNPCIDCNRYLKFGILLNKARAMGFDYIATGHYAKIEKEGEEVFLKIPKDQKKDQTYFLYQITRENLKYILFPLSDLTKDQVRGIARKQNLAVADKPQSQDICFVPEKKYKKFILDRGIHPCPGHILDLEGNILGKHEGVSFYTIGQRKGLGVSAGAPQYVVRIDAGRNIIILGNKDDLKSKGFIAGDINFFTDNIPEKSFVKIRYSQTQARCRISCFADKLFVIFEKRQEAVTPGQAAVFYDNDTVLGGGVIEEVFNGYN